MVIAANARYGRLLLTAGFVGLVLSSSAIRMTAQITTAGIAGLVADQGGAIIPGVTVTATEVATGFTRSAITGADCRFNLLELPLGTYTLTAEKTGFAKVQQTGPCRTSYAALTPAARQFPHQTTRKPRAASLSSLFTVSFTVVFDL
jgi:hypothetical protein